MVEIRGRDNGQDKGKGKERGMGVGLSTSNELVVVENKGRERKGVGDSRSGGHANIK
jgi:hypothetical protein